MEYVIGLGLIMLGTVIGIIAMSVMTMGKMADEQERRSMLTNERDDLVQDNDRLRTENLILQEDLYELQSKST